MTSRRLLSAPAKASDGCPTGYLRHSDRRRGVGTISRGPGECFIWWVPRGMLRARHLQLLDPIEDQRRLGYRFLADGERFALGAAVLRLGVASVVGVDPARLRVDRRCDSCG